ncbi:hypothetical protein BDB01DRAFT_721630 [Pilobolus umbonatus]|nr:hypothetical protein BDB01DRAFT_721630 [Pilobolus umbonatus]
MNMLNTTLAATQAAGMANFGRNIRPYGRPQNGGIYAATTAVQQDIFRLERDLEKLLINISIRSHYSSFGDAATINPKERIDNIHDKHTNNSTVGRKSKFKHSAAQQVAELNKDNHTENSHISTIMTSILEAMKRHKLATELPLKSEILSVLATPFDKHPFHEADGYLALDVFDYIRERFKLSNARRRIIDSINALIIPAIDNVDYLPSTPTAFHSIVYSTVHALAQLNMTADTKEEESVRYIQSNIMHFLCQLADGQIIHPQGEEWNSYYDRLVSPTSIPISVSKLCIVECLLKCLMVGSCAQENAYQGTISNSDRFSLIKREKDRLIVNELLPRYWTEPELATKPIYLRILLLITELACETALTADLNDLKEPSTSVSLVISLVLDKLIPKKIDQYLISRKTNQSQKTLTYNIFTALLYLFSIIQYDVKDTNINSSLHSSPNFRPQPSIPDIKSTLSAYEIQDYKSVKSIELDNVPDLAYQETISNVKDLFEQYWNLGYTDFIIQSIESVLQDATGERVARLYSNISFHIDPIISSEIVRKTLPTLFTTLKTTSPPPISILCKLLYDLSIEYKTVFYKPVVSCVATENEDKIAEQFGLITCLRQYLTGVQFWMQDAEMINVLLLSDIGKGKLNKNRQAEASNLLNPDSVPNKIHWGSATLGQCVIAMELVWVIKDLREKQRDDKRNMEDDETAKKFLIDLEKRLSVFLAAKEKTMFVPLPARIILCNLFSNIRFFCYTTHRPGWLTRVIEWAIQPIVSTADHPYQQQKPDIPTDTSIPPTHVNSEGNVPILHMGHIEDSVNMFQRLQSLYLRVLDKFDPDVLEADHRASIIPKDNIFNHRLDNSGNYPPDTRHKRYCTISQTYPSASTAAASLNLSPPPLHNNDYKNITFNHAKYQIENLSKINQDPYGSVLSLLAAVFTTISTHEFARLAKPLWEFHMEDRNPRSFIPAAFLLMECGDKIPGIVTEICTNDFYSVDYIPVSSRRRPFRGDGGAFSTPFVPADVGSNEFVLDEPYWMSKLKSASNFPIELKRQIQELGWDDDDQGEEHETMKKVLTPLTLLPSLYLEDEEEERGNEEENGNANQVKESTKAFNISKLIAARKRATTIPAITISFLSMVDLLYDDFGGVTNGIRELLGYFMRDDPSLFLRSFLKDIGKFKLDRHKDNLTRIHSLVRMQHKLPPGFTYILFNYLAGMLKWMSRETKQDSMVLMTLIHPILAELTLSTNDLSIRDLRKNKIEHLLASSGKFWFTHEQPMEMFPRYLSNHKSPFTKLNIPSEVFSVGMLRVSHIQFLINYLTRYPRDVYAVKKSLQDYEPTPIPHGNKKMASHDTDDQWYPDLNRRNIGKESIHTKKKEAKRFSDSEQSAPQQPRQQQIDIELLSSLRARIWLRFVDTLLSGLNKNYNDRDELDRILQGINSIIVEHHCDFAILGQALILYTRVITRFKRLFISNRGYTTFLSALFKVFCEVECYPQARSAFTFAWCRFYAVHEEAFVFQMLGSLVPLVLTGYTKSDELGSWMSDNLFVLMQAMHNPPVLDDGADILGLKFQIEIDDEEREIQERIDAVSNPIMTPLSNTILKPLAKSITTPIVPLNITSYHNRPFELQSFIKLFLTIIAYDPGSLRAEQFVKILRHLCKHFYSTPDLKDIMDEGIAALIDVFTKFSKAAKTFPSFTGNNHSNTNPGYLNGEESRQTGGSRTESSQLPHGKQRQQNDRFTVKREFVLLVQAYLKQGGQLLEVNHEKMANIIKAILRDHGNKKGILCPTNWIKDYLIDVLQSMNDLRNTTRSFKKLLNTIFNQYESQWKTTEASDLYEGLAYILEQSQGKAIVVDDIAAIIHEKYVVFGLTISTGNSWENDSKRHVKFCNALVRLIVAILENSSEDVLSDIENQPITSTLIGHIVIPLCLQFNLQSEFKNVGIANQSRYDPTPCWTRLLSFISRACSQATLLKNKTSGFSLAQLASTMSQNMPQEGLNRTEHTDTKDGKQNPQSIALLFSLSFVAMKIIFVRSSGSLDAIKGSWAQIAYFIKSSLVFGQTLRFLKPKSGKSSPQLSSPNPLPFFVNTSAMSTNLPSNASAGIGTIYDFTTWRFLEFVVCYRTPLLVFLKDFIQTNLNSMEGNVSSRRPSLYIPSPSSRENGSMNFGQSPTKKPIWSSGGLSPSLDEYHSPPGIIPKVNIQDLSETEVSSNINILSQDVSFTSGLGLHLPNTSKTTNRSTIPPKISPIHSFSSHSEASDVENDNYVNPALSPKLTSPYPLDRKNTDLSSFPGDNLDTTDPSTVLHLLYAESITSAAHVQISMKSKPVLPWMTSHYRQQMKPWTDRQTMSKIVNEWQLLLQLSSESVNESSDSKLQHPSSNNVNNPVPSTPLL